MTNKLSTIFKKNRAEEFPDDLWNTFILPVEYEQWNLLDNDKGVRVIGGRGTGKTMFLKYHCFPTQLSHKKSFIGEEELTQVGIYWRPDTHFVQLINQKYLNEKWIAIFNTYVGLSLIIKLSEFIKKLLSSNYSNNHTIHILRELKISSILSKELNCEKPILYTDLEIHCRGLLYQLQNWLHNTKKDLPLVIDGKSSLLYIIDTLKSKNIFINTTFHIFIDEFENLTNDQQCLVNTWLKHGEKPLLYSIAYKKYAKLAIETTGEETLQRRNDYRIIDIVEDVYAKDDKSFKIFASEIIASKINIFLDKTNSTELSDRKGLVPRRQKAYKTNVIKIARQIFPEKSYSEIAKDIMNDDSMYQKVRKNISQALAEKGFKIDATKFMSKDFADATLVNSTLLFRARTSPKELLEKFELLQQVPDFKHKNLKDYKELIKHNIVGSILHIYTYYSQRICPIYAGFDRFCLMSKNNIRHLLELCYQSFLELEYNITDFKEFHKNIPTVNVDLQLKAAKFCSKQELETISELGPYGQDLQKIADRLGRIFRLKQMIKSQSKPENIHFSVETVALENIENEIQILINQAKMWNVLQEYNATKGTADDIATKEYMLTPILAPFYKITPRKIQKIDFSVDDLRVIFLSNDEKFNSFFENLIKEWKVNSNNEAIQYCLFGDLF